jgi:hypothetical protein
MTVELTVVIGIACSLIGVVVGLANTQRTRDKELREKASGEAVVLTELGYVKSGIDDIKRKQEAQDEKYLDMAERMVKVEASAKQAHHRIDAMDGKDER